MLDAPIVAERVGRPRHGLGPASAPPWPDPTDQALLRQAFAPAVPSEAVLRRLLDAARLVRCPAGPLTVASPRRPEPSWWLVRQGRIGLGPRTAGGSVAELRWIGTGEWLDVAGALSGHGGWLEHAVCHTPVELLAVPLGALYDACAAHPAFAQAFAGVLAQRVRSLNDTLHELAGADVPVRFARWLLRQLAAHGDDSATPRLVLGERKQAIARQLRTTSETLSRTLARLSRDGILEVKGYALTVRDPAALRALARAPHE
ncbi:MAG: Crp/Fnr family transcriptional regulator [Piscinibacter sp.]|nr:Crp/Fnr family transcriptional regulator [Piscinibacter sp.]